MMFPINLTLGLGSAITSFGFFIFCRYLVDPLTYLRLSTNKQNNQNISSPYFRTWFTYSDQERWQRLNLLISWLHAFITGVLVLYSFWSYPELSQDFVKHVNFITYITCSLSWGIITNRLIEFSLLSSIIYFRLLLVRSFRYYIK